jgi:predicted dienelactone hydrolase
MLVLARHLSGQHENPCIMMGYAMPLKRILTIMIGLAAIGIIAVIGLVMYVAIERSRPERLPAPAGTYTVGRYEFVWSDPFRADPFSGDPARRRELPIWIWYPAQAHNTAAPAPYLPEDWSQARAQDSPVRAWLSQIPGTVRTGASEDPPVAGSGTSYPVLVFSAGYGSIPADYTTTIEDLASHGYVVAGVANPGIAPVVVYPDGQKVSRLPQGTLPESGGAQALQPVANRLVEVEAGDAISTLDALASLNEDPASLFYHRLDVTRAGFLGHSFGGAASAEACREDARCLAAADLDGTLFGKAVREGLAKPFLIISEDPAQVASLPADKASFRSAVQQGAVWITIKGTRHFNFTDGAVMFNPVLHLAGVLGPIDEQRALRISDDYLLAFLDKAIDGVSSPLLAGPSSRYPEVVFEH